MKRLHIVGCPRSGTTLLMELISTCFASGGFCEHEMSIFAPLELSPDIDLYITKQPNDIRQLGHIFARDENLFIIYSGRDPRAVITSKHRENPDEYFSNYRIWAECDRAAQHYHGHARFLSLRYEDLVADPDNIQREIGGQFPFLQRRHRFSEYSQFANSSAASRRAMNGLRAVNADSLVKWHEHLPRIAEQYQRHPRLAQDLIRLGYESDERWTSMLDGIVGVDYPCRYPERRPRLKEWEKALRVYLKSRGYLSRLGR